MADLEKLRAIREKEAKEFMQFSKGKQEEMQLKQDIKKIRGAKLRTQLGLKSGDVERIGAGVKQAGKVLGGTLKGVGKVLLTMGDRANRYYRQKPPRY